MYGNNALLYRYGRISLFQRARSAYRKPARRRYFFRVLFLRTVRFSRRNYPDGKRPA